MYKIMTIDEKIRDETLEYDINREAAKFQILPSGPNDTATQIYLAITYKITWKIDKDSKDLF